MSSSDQMYDEAVKLKDEGNLEAAVAKLNQVVEQDPDHLLSHAALGVYMQRLGRFDEAITHAKRVTELDPADPFSFTLLSVIYQRCGRIPEAEDAMARAREMQMNRR